MQTCEQGGENGHELVLIINMYIIVMTCVTILNVRINHVYIRVSDHPLCIYVLRSFMSLLA